MEEEMWRDKLSGLDVAVTHVTCDHREELAGDGEPIDPQHGDYPHYRMHERDREFLESRGFWYKVSDASWYRTFANLVVIARVDVVDMIRLPHIRDWLYDYTSAPLPPQDLDWSCVFPGCWPRTD